MKTLYIFLVSFYIPGTGQLILKDYQKGVLILGLLFGFPFLISFVGFLNFIPIWLPYLLLMIWSIFDVYDKIEALEGRKSANKNLAFSILIVFVLIPVVIFLIFTSLFKGGQHLTDEYINGDRTKTEMNKISTELDRYKNHYGFYPAEYSSFISTKPTRSGWETDGWKKPYLYKLQDSTHYKLISAGKDGILNTIDDIIQKNE